jgi:hypothetical protein
LTIEAAFPNQGKQNRKAKECAKHCANHHSIVIG